MASRSAAAPRPVWLYTAGSPSPGAVAATAALRPQAARLAVELSRLVAQRASFMFSEDELLSCLTQLEVENNGSCGELCAYKYGISDSRPVESR